MRGCARVFVNLVLVQTLHIPGVTVCSDDEEEFKQKCKWRLKTKSKFDLDRERTQEVYELVTKAKGKARRDIK